MEQILENIRKEFIHDFEKNYFGFSSPKHPDIIANWWISHLTHAIEVEVEKKKTLIYHRYSTGMEIDAAVEALDTILATLKEVNQK